MTLTPPYQADVFRIPPKDFNPKVETAACYINFDGKYLFLHRSKGNPLQTVIREVHEERNKYSTK